MLKCVWFANSCIMRYEECLWSGLDEHDEMVISEYSPSRKEASGGEMREIL